MPPGMYNGKGMMREKAIKIELNAVEETLVIPLWARAKEAETKDPIVNDMYARDLIARMDYDFSKLETKYMEQHHLVWSYRAYNFDKCVRKFLEKNSRAAVINIGAGLNTTYQRVDNGRVHWINIDLPDAAALRQKLIPDSEREMTVAKTVFDFSWMDDIAHKINGRPILFMAAGVLCYFEDSELETLFRRLSTVYPSAHFLFDAMSRFTVWISNRTIIKKSGMDSSAMLKWHLKKASRLKKWVKKIKIIEEYPMFAGVPVKKEWSKKMIWDVRIAGRLRLYNMVHIQF